MAAAQPPQTTADSPHHIGAPISDDAAALALRDGPIGALVVASIAVALLFIAWLVFYFLLFMPRGPIG
jgi:hypothetical protein